MNQNAERPRRGRYAEAERNDLLVLDAAREVFAARGADATVAAIAERAGVGMGSLYRRYGSKDDLLRHLCIMAMEQAIEAAAAALADADTTKSAGASGPPKFHDRGASWSVFAHDAPRSWRRVSVAWRRRSLGGS